MERLGVKTEECAKACPSPHAHRWWLPPADCTQFCRMNEEAGTFASGFAVMGATLVHDARTTRRGGGGQFLPAAKRGMRVLAQEHGLQQTGEGAA